MSSLPIDIETQEDPDFFSDGLHQKQVTILQEEYGFNELPIKKTSVFILFFRQFNNVLVYILFFALALSIGIPLLEGGGLRLATFTDAIVIFSILLVNALFAFVQEYKAENSVASLQKLTSPFSRVRREGQERMIPSRELVVGDIVIIEAGDKISADGILLQVSHLEVNESSLTGESVSRSKDTQNHKGTDSLAEQDNLVFSGTLVTAGSGEYRVSAIAKDTQIGKISDLVSNTETPQTPLQMRLAELGKRLGVIVLILTAAIAGVGIIQGKELFEILLMSVSLAVSAVPEGLPAVVTVCFVLGIQRMIGKNALVQRLNALETLGSVTVICSDKTGTITENKMKVVDYWLSHEQTQEHLVQIGGSCNRAQLPNLGDPTEIGLLEHSHAMGIERLEIDEEEIPFNSTDKFMQTRHGEVSYLKGAVEKILNIVDPKNRARILEANEAMAKKGLRVLACAQKAQGQYEFVGLLALEDPPRATAAEAIKTAQQAGIRSIMITGDNAITAQAIAHAVGIQGPVIEGKDLDTKSQAELLEIVQKIDIYARVSPENKLQILKALQAQGEIVAMSGDGVNDAPALKGSHVGIAMGMVGTQVAREAASMVLVDDHFSTIVAAIQEGRRIYDNIKKFIFFLLRTNFDELLLITVIILVGWPLPYLPAHILWLNLVTDSLPALALGVEKAEPDIMKRKPRPATEGILHGEWGNLILGAVVGFIAGFILFALLYKNNVPIETIRSVLLTMAIFYELLIVHTVRSKKPLSEIGFLSNPWIIGATIVPLGLHICALYSPLGGFLGLVPLSLEHWLYVLGFALTGPIFFEGLKYFKRFMKTKNKFENS